MANQAHEKERMSLKERTITGLFWSLVDSIANQGVQFVVGIILARLLSPREFGLVGMLTIFIAVSQTFIDSGFSNALIRKKDCTETDYSTVFFFNLAVGVLAYSLLFAFAGLISSFFDEPLLKPILRVLGLSLVFGSFGIIERTILTKNIDFKLQTRVSVVASVGSGAVAIYMAYAGYGVWSLVALTVTRFGLTSFFLWFWVRWIPRRIFSMHSFNELFSFGSKLLASGLINTIYNNIYYLVIGKFFSAVELGYYTRADEFNALPSQNLNSIISRVSYPVLSSIQDDKLALKAVYRKLIRSTMFVTFVLMIGMAAVARPMIITLIGTKWLPTVIYLQMLAFVGMFYPLHSLNLNMLNVSGRSDLYLRLELIKKALAAPTIVVGVFLGIKVMIVGMMINTLIGYYLNSYWSGRFINYSFAEQVRDIFPSLMLALAVGAVVHSIGLLAPLSPVVLLSVQICSGAVLTIGYCEIMEFRDYIYLKATLVERFTDLYGVRNGINP
jgi:teichuronic acid exporter